MPLAARRGGSWIRHALMTSPGGGGESPYAREASHDRRQLLRCQIAAIGQHNQFRRRGGLTAHGIRQCEDRLARFVNRRQFGDQRAARLLDAPADLLLLLLGQKFAPADGVQIRPDQVSFFLLLASRANLPGRIVVALISDLVAVVPHRILASLRSNRRARAGVSMAAAFTTAAVECGKKGTIAADYSRAWNKPPFSVRLRLRY